MKKIIFSIVTVLLFSLYLLPFDSNQVQAATIGQQLKQPEDGWKRYDDTDPAIRYDGSFGTESNTNLWGGTHRYTVNKSNEIKFRIKSNSLRLIGFRASNRSTSVEIEINREIYYFSQSGSSLAHTLFFQKLDLASDVVHEVTIRNNSTTPMVFDAIDIDLDGYLVPLDVESPTLNGEVTNEGHALTWNLIDGVNGYKVKRSLNADGPYEVIASNVTTNSYIDKDIEKGIKYYYVVTAIVNGAESDNSNEVVLPNNNSNATLVLHLINNQIKEYNLTSSELNNFLNWFASGSESFYVFTLKSPEPPYNSIKDYIIKDKIVWFQVKEY